jgi:hypothetical protein
MSAIALRPRQGTELLDAAFALYRRMARPLLTVSALLMLPYIALSLLRPDGSRWLVLTVAVVGGALLRGVVIVLVADFLRGRPEDIAGALRLTLRCLPSIIGAELQFIFLCILGLFMLVVPGLLAYGSLFAYPHAILLEGASVELAMHRSSALTKDRVWSTCGVLLVAFLIPFLLGKSVDWTAHLVSTVASPPAVTWSIARALATVALAPFAGVFTTLLYFDLRARKEGLDLDLLMRELPADMPTGGPLMAPRHLPATDAAS